MENELHPPGTWNICGGVKNVNTKFDGEIIFITRKQIVNDFILHFDSFESFESSLSFFYYCDATHLNFYWLHAQVLKVDVCTKLPSIL